MGVGPTRAAAPPGLLPETGGLSDWRPPRRLPSYRAFRTCRAERGGRCGCLTSSLGLDDDLDAAIVGATLGGGVIAHRPGRPEALCRDTISGDAARHEVVAHGLRAIARQLLIELRGTL